MISSWTQTYGDKRTNVYNLKNFDYMDMYFRKKLDKNVYSFHGVPEKIKHKLYESKFITDINFNFFDFPSSLKYPKTYYKSLMKLKSMGIEYILFLQDDCWVRSSITKQNCDDLYHIIKNTKFNIINLETKSDRLIANDEQLDDLLITTKGDIKLYRTDTKNALWGDYPFIANINYLLSSVYDSLYFNEKDIWKAEYQLSHRIKKNKIIEMYTLNIPFYHRHGISGRSGREHFKKNLQELTKTYIHKNKEFCFNNDFFSENIKTTMNLLVKMFSNTTNNILEIGSHEGRSATFMLQHLCNSENSSFLSIDPYNKLDTTCCVTDETKELFGINIKLCDNFEKFEQINDYSGKILPKLLIDKKSFNIIYVDGSHTYNDVATDLLYSHKLLRKNGVIIVDDVGFPGINGYTDIKKACNEFLEKYTNYHLLQKEYQWIFLKI